MTLCPICSKDSQARYRPFCSRRCADIDLGRWLSESYRVASAEEDAEEQGEEAGFSVSLDRHGKSRPQ